MKRFIAYLTLAVCSLTSAWAQYSGSGSGTTSDPYKIYYPYQLHQVRNYLGQEGVVFKLMNDIDLADFISDNFGFQGWEPIGVESQPFKGVLDGNNKKLTGFSINRSTTDNIGLFGYIDGATVKNLTINGPVTGQKYVGAFVGCASGSCMLSGLTHNGAITANSYAGHIVGQCSGAVSSVSAIGNVTSAMGIAGGIVGCHNTSEKTISNVRMTGNVTASNSSSTCVGGIAGMSYATISNATCSGDIQGGQYVGGITGRAFAAVSTSTVNGTVKGTSSAGFTGGIVGVAESGVNITDSRINGEVTGTTIVGGISGQSMNGTMVNCYSYCDVTGTSNYVGGVLGKGASSVVHCCSFGNVSGASYVGGVVGDCSNSSLSDTAPNTVTTYYVYNVNGKVTTYGGVSKSSSICSILNSYSVGKVKGTGNYVGGVAGYVKCGLSYTGESGKFTASQYDSNGNKLEGKKGCYYYQVNSGEINYKEVDNYITAQPYTAYTVTDLSMSVNDCYFSGDVSGAENVGGIVGYMNGGSLERNYSNATIAGTTVVGGIAGNVIGFIANSFDISHPLVLGSNMAINTSVVATSNAGRIYGSRGNDVTVASPGTTNDNRALESGRLIINGVTQELENSEQNGQNNGDRYFRLRANYVSHGWDLNNNWKISDTETYPYKPWQAAPPTITSSLVAGCMSISGQSVDGGTVYVTAGKNAERSTTCSDNSWTVSGLSALASGENVTLYAKVSGKENSYRTLAIVEYFNGNGSGTEEDPWLIYTAYDLQGVYKEGYYKQMNDIDLTSWISENNSTAGWTPVGYEGTGAVVYDGNNHKVTGLWVHSTENYAGLFSSFSKGTIRNLTVEATSKQVIGVNYVGIVIGKIGQGTIENVKAKGNITAGSYVGGIAGLTNGTTLNNLTYTGQLTASGYVGGITSYTSSAVGVSECEAKDVTIKGTASYYVGGLVGYSNSGTFERCTSILQEHIIMPE